MITMERVEWYWILDVKCMRQEERLCTQFVVEDGGRGRPAEHEREIIEIRVVTMVILVATRKEM